MKRLNLSSMVATTAVLLTLGSFAMGQEVSSQNVVGFVKIPISNGFNLLSVPMQKVASYAGTIQDNTGDTITVSGTPWSGGQFAWGVEGQESAGKSYFYLEVSDTSSPFEGRHMYITNSTANTLTIKGGIPSDIQDNDLDTVTFKIVAANRIRDIFGHPESPTEVVLTPKNDFIYLWNGTSWEDGIYFFGPGLATYRNKWVQDTNIVSDLIIDRDEGFFVDHSGTGTNLTIAGEVSQNNQAIVLDTGFALVGGEYVIEEAVEDTSLSGSVSPKNDFIIPWSGTGWEDGVYFYGPGLAEFRNKWVQDTNIVGNTFSFEVGKAYFFNMSSSTNWVKVSPLR